MFVSALVSIMACATATVDTSKLEEDIATLQERLDAAEQRIVPSGTIVAYAYGEPPEGWLLCNGTPVEREKYPDLYHAIGTTWGVGDGSTTFNVPDLRGRFLRGDDKGAGNDPDYESRMAASQGGAEEGVGTLQDDNLASHFHDFSATTEAYTHSHSGSTDASDDLRHTYEWDQAYNLKEGTGNAVYAPAGWTSGYGSLTFTTSSDTHSHSLSGSTEDEGGVETRPANAAVLYIIKY